MMAGGTAVEKPGEAASRGEKDWRESLFFARNARRIWRVFQFAGFDPLRCVVNIAGVPRYVGDAIRYTRRTRSPEFAIRWLDLFPVLNERKQAAGMVGGHYFHQDLWAARRIFSRRPDTHTDIGSRIDGFIAHLLAFMPVTVIDIRAIESPLPGLTFLRDDATRLSRLADNSVDSLSSLHVAEHFGLGRYSDPIEPDAWLCFASSLERVLRPGGRLYFSVPVGRERVDFNAHRVFAVPTILRAFSRLKLVSFSLVDDAGRLHADVNPAVIPETEYGCGLFEFTKPLGED
jgi:hypothetical protein